MAGESLQTVLRRLRRLAAPPAAGLTDAQLLGRFVAGGDEAAFELLLRRHGGMVLGLCRRLSRHEQDAEDAFQATFLALARKARSIGKPASLGSWLYKVAYRAALSARARAVRRAAVEVPLAAEPVADPVPAADWHDLRPVLDAEIHRLPDRYRVPFVLCYLEGLSLAEAARLLGRPPATVGTRLARARDRLRERLTSRGLGLSAAALSAFVAEQTRAAGLPARLVGAMLAALPPGAVPARIAVLTEGVLRAMFVSKLKTVTAVVLAAVTLSTGVGGLGYRMFAADGPGDQLAPAKAGKDAPPPHLVASGWGTLTDPDGDCKFTIEKDRMSIAVPGTDHALCIEQKRMNAPRVLRPVEGDFIVQVKVSGTYPVGGKSLVGTRRPFHGAGLLLWKDANNYARLERAQVMFDGQAGSYANWELRKDGDFARMGGAGELDLKDAATWLRVERQGNTLYGSVSANGVQWTTLEPMAVDLPRKLLVGICAGQNTNLGFTPTFEHFRLFQTVGEP
jgi:RNA polymerase sigma factor (sigma-70 family)